MSSFGLGLVLSFTDNASAGLRNATQNFQQMSLTVDQVSSSVSSSIYGLVSSCYALDSIGDTLVNVGSTILGVYSNVSQTVIDSGLQMQGYRMQMAALYGSVEAGEAKIQEIKQYAMESVFEIQSLIPAVTMMKAVGIEAMADITTSSGKHTQKLLDYASDLAAMMPNMRNTYGTGVAAAMGAFKEYIAEGNALSLKRGAGLDITGILGEDKGKTIEERTQQIADLIEKLNIVGYTTNLAGTPTQRLSNMQDALFNTLTQIADSGVFEVYCGLLEKVSEWVFSLVENEETFNLITGILADTISTLLSPLNDFLDFVISNSNALLDWIKNNEELTKKILTIVAVIGAVLVAGGLLLKFASALGMAVAGFTFLKSFPALLRNVASGFGSLIIKSLPFLALAGLLYYAWTTNLFGIRDTLTEAAKDIKDIFTVISDAWGDMELSAENYDLANSLGILPLVEALLQLKYYWGYFTEGFKTGFNAFFQSLQDTFGTFGIDLSDIFAKIGEFLKSLIEFGQEDKWTKIGEVAGKIAGVAVSILALVKVFSFLKPLFSLFGKKGALGSAGAGGVTGAGGTVSSLKNMVIILLGLAAVLAVVGLISLIPFSVPRVLQLIAVIGVLGIVGVVLTKLSSLVGKVPVTSVALGLANIAIIMAGLSAVLAVIGLVSMMPISVPRVIQLIAVIGIIGVLGGVLSGISAIISLIPITAVALGLANIAIVMLALAGVCAVIGMVSSIASPGAIMQTVVVIAAIGVIGGVLSGVAALIGVIPFPVVLAGIANIVTVVGALTGLAYVISEALPTIGENLNSFITALEPAFKAFGLLQGLDMANIGSFFTSFGEFMLMISGSEILSFFSGGTDLAGVAGQLVSFATTSKTAFEAFGQIPIGSINNFSKAVGAISSLSSISVSGNNLSSIGTQFSSLVSSLKTSVADFPEIDTGMIEAITHCTTESMNLLNTFSASGTSVGSALMNSIASGIRAQTAVVSNALRSALNGISVVASPSVSLNIRPNVNTTGMVGLATGGYVKETGVAVLHPNEVVVNDELTQGLRDFLSQQNDYSRSGSSSSSSSSSSSGSSVSNDYSVTFSKGSVVVQVVNATESELEKAADRLMQIIERKQQLKAMATRA